MQPDFLDHAIVITYMGIVINRIPSKGRMAI
jgi:hypothetical protein